MLLLWTEPDYLLWLGGITLALVAVPPLLVAMRRRWRRRRKTGRWREWLLKGCLGVWTLLALVVLLEWVFAALVDHSEGFNGTNVSKRWYLRHMDGEKNTDGFRDRRALSDPLPEGGRRIVVLGDSFVAGCGVDRMEDRLTERLEQMFNADGEPHVQVYNAGWPGYEVSLIEALLKAILDRDAQVDLVIYCYMLNDIEGYDPRTTPFLEQLNRHAPVNPLITRTYFLNWMYYRLDQMHSSASMSYFPHLIDSYQTPAWDHVDHSLERMNQLCQVAGVEFRMALMPFMQDLGPKYEFRDVHTLLSAWGEDHGVPVLDLEPVLAAHRDRNLSANRFDRHPNELAHSLMAAALYGWLSTDSRLLGPDPAKTGEETPQEEKPAQSTP